MSTRVVNKNLEPFDIDISRESIWGNPFSHNPRSKAKWLVSSRDEAIRQYRHWIVRQPELMARLGELKDKTLGCYCRPKACHGDVLVDLVDNSLWSIENDQKDRT